jgi:hypothetical protein
MQDNFGDQSTHPWRFFCCSRAIKAISTAAVSRPARSVWYGLRLNWRVVGHGASPEIPPQVRLAHLLRLEEE